MIYKNGKLNAFWAIIYYNYTEDEYIELIRSVAQLEHMFGMSHHTPVEGVE